MIDGATLALVVGADEAGALVCRAPADAFVALAKSCRSVVLARSSPLQKALVVMLVRRYEPAAVTLAIGDGANDVSMIRAAHVGIGVSGQEGMQAVRACDYAIRQFQDLQRLLLHHGRLSYVRLANMTTYFFYKNIAFTFVLWIFGAVSHWSAQNFYVDMLVTVYNSASRGEETRDKSLSSLRLVFSLTLSRARPSRASLPPRSAVHAHSALHLCRRRARRPRGQGRALPRDVRGLAARHALLVARDQQRDRRRALPRRAALLRAGARASDRKDPHGLWTAGNASFAIVVLHAHVRIFIITRHWTPLTIAGNLISVALFFAMSICYDDYDPDWVLASSIVTTASSQGSMTRVFQSPAWWLLCLLCIERARRTADRHQSGRRGLRHGGHATLADFIRGQSLQECQAFAGTVGPSRADTDARATVQAEKSKSVELTWCLSTSKKPSPRVNKTNAPGSNAPKPVALGTSNRDDAAEGETCGTMLLLVKRANAGARSISGPRAVASCAGQNFGTDAGSWVQQLAARGSVMSSSCFFVFWFLEMHGCFSKSNCNLTSCKR